MAAIRWLHILILIALLYCLRLYAQHGVRPAHQNVFPDVHFLPAVAISFAGPAPASEPGWVSTTFGVLCASFALLLLHAYHRRRALRLTADRDKPEELLRERTHELELSREAFRIRAMHDDLTGLLNRRAILEVLDREIARAIRSRTALTVILADLDRFKAFNDTYGQMSGDAALGQAAASLRNAIRDYDHVGRYGGEEFLLILPGLPPHELQARLADLHRSISNLSVITAEGAFTLNCSFGATSAFLTDSALTADTLLIHVDQALQAAKEGGRNRFEVRLPAIAALPCERSPESTER
jgi:diguanylate cyclase (GGDEF)-like protein